MKFLFALSLLCATAVMGQKSTTESWETMFNGKDLTGWTPKIRYAAAGENAKNTFRVVDEKLVVSYDQYDTFNEQFGHLFYNKKFSYYRIKLQYRFTGEQAKDGPGWAYRNSGIMIHGQAANTMGLAQDFPISIEVQLLGGFDDRKPRANCNLCTPGTTVWYEGQFDTRHCINSNIQAAPLNEWVRAEVEVYGDSLIRHWVNGEIAMEYSKPAFGGGVVSGFNPEDKPDGQALTHGSISLQSESHPVEFRKVELLNFKGCMNPEAKNYKAYYIKNDEASCQF